MLFTHKANRCVFHYPHVVKHPPALHSRNTKQAHDRGERRVVQSNRHPHICAPLRAHRVEDLDRRVVLGKDIKRRLVAEILRSQPEGCELRSVRLQGIEELRSGDQFPWAALYTSAK